MAAKLGDQWSNMDGIVHKLIILQLSTLLSILRIYMWQNMS